MPKHEDELYERARRVRGTFESLTFQVLNPTFGELRRILGVMSVGYGESAHDHEHDIEEVERLLKRKNIAIKEIE